MRSMLFVAVALVMIACVAGSPSVVPTWALCDTAVYPVTDLNVTLSTVSKGADISIEMSGQVNVQVTGGNNLISVKFMGVPLHSETDPISEGMSLPVGPGPFDYKKSVNIPGIAPSGPYVVNSLFQDASGTELTCINISFTL